MNSNKFDAKAIKKIKRQDAVFGREKLAGLEPLDLSFLKISSHCDLNNQNKTECLALNTTGQIKFSLDQELVFKLNLLKSKHKVAYNVFLKSIFAILINQYTQQNKFCVCTLFATSNDKENLCKEGINFTFYDFTTSRNLQGLIDQSSQSVCLPKSEIAFASNSGFLNFALVDMNVPKDALAMIESASDLIFKAELRSLFNYNVEYNLDKINSDLLNDFIGRYKRIFKEILEDLLLENDAYGLKLLENYRVLSGEEHKEIIYTWNDTYKNLEYNKTFNELFEEQVSRTPSNIAITYENVTLTYEALNEKANALANYIKQNHNIISPDTFIVFFLERSEHILIAILAILKTGAAYVPINPEYPDERILYILNDTKAPLILTNEIHQQRIFEISKLSSLDRAKSNNIQTNQAATILAIDSEEIQKQLLLQSKENIGGSYLKATNLIYIIYTSGTTGKPKGVMIEHRSFVATIECMRNFYFGNKQFISTYNHTHYAFDMVGPEYGLPLLTGGTIFMGNNDFDVLDCLKYDFIQMTPSLCDLKLERLTNTLNTKLIVGAESLSEELLVKILKKSIDVVHVYGPTETSVWSTSKYYSCAQDPSLISVLLGKPFENEKVYVLDKKLNPLPVGTVGELYIGGIGLARGYLNKPELTEEKFIRNPFQTDEEKASNLNARLYKTGDLGRWVPGGELEYIGRNDFQVKIRGYRVELGEIESSLSTYEGIKQSVVLAREHINKEHSSTGHKYLIGYYVADFKLDEEEIVKHLHRQLPDYMVPNILIHLHSLPLTINGKLDRKALPEFNFISAHYVAPRNEQEQALCAIWADVFGFQDRELGIEDDFFKVGGDSILAIRLVSRVNNALNTRIKVRDIFESRCISKLIPLIEENNQKEEKDESYVAFSLVNIENFKNSKLDIRLIEDIYPASFLQVRMLFESKIDKHSAYHIVSNYSVHEKFDEAKFLSIFDSLFKKHPLLRARFILNDKEEYCLAIFKSVKINYIYLTQQNSKELVLREKLNYFDYDNPSLFKIIINNQEHSFDIIFTFHHAIEDGWSMASLINEFEQAYINNTPIALNLKCSYGEYVQNELAAIKNQDNINFWRNYLKDLNIPKINWKLDEEKSEDSLYTSFFILTPEQIKWVHKISKTLNISVDSVFLLVYFKTLSYFTHNADITVGLVVNNRLEKEDGDKIFGLFLNIIPYRFNLKTEENDLNQLLSVFDSKLQLQKYKALPYDYIRSFFDEELYEFVFNFVHLHILNDRVSSIESVYGYERTHIPFTLTVVQKGTDLFVVSICAHDDFISKDFLEKFALYYQSCLQTTFDSIQQAIGPKSMNNVHGGSPVPSFNGNCS